MSVVSKERRQIYARRIRGFWSDFSHNKIGFVGLIIIIAYVVMAAAGPDLTPYPPVNSPRVSSGYAQPIWLTIFPQYSNLPETRWIPLNWTPSESYPEINTTALQEGQLVYRPTDGIGINRTYKFVTEFTWTKEMPAEFEAALVWHADFKDVTYRLELNLTDTTGREIRLLGYSYHEATKRVEVRDVYWNMKDGNWLITSNDVEFARGLRYEELYHAFFESYYEQQINVLGYLEYQRITNLTMQSLYNRTLGGMTGFSEYFPAWYDGSETWTGWNTTLSGYNSTFRTMKYNDHFYTLRYYWQRAFGNLTGYNDYFQQYWYGNATWSGFWNHIGQVMLDKEIALFATDAVKIADARAKDEADQACRATNPINESLSGKGEYAAALYLHIQPNSAGAALDIEFDSNTRIRMWGLLHGILGSDTQGRDNLTQILSGARISLIVGGLAAVLATSLEIVFGVASGYLGGFVDEATMRVVDVLLCLPTLPLLLALSAYFRPNVYFIVLIIAIFGWQGGARVIRSRVLTLREMPFVESARSSGASDSYLIFRHLIPNVFPIAIASMILAVPAAILTEAAISFLGFGDPLAPTWGKMLQEAQDAGAFSQLAWWYILPPGFCITILCVGFVFLGHALDEVVNPRLRRRR